MSISAVQDRFWTFEHVWVPSNEPDEDGSLFVGLAATLFPPLQCSRVDAALVREDANLCAQWLVEHAAGASFIMPVNMVGGCAARWFDSTTAISWQADAGQVH
jgi:hypothetical protein